MPPTTQIRIRRDTAANFTSANPTLALGEIAYETDTFRFKVGTGSTAWTALGYAAQNPTSLTVTDSTASTTTTTGALRVTGGVGIGGAVNAGSDAVFNGVRIGRGAAPDSTTRVGNSAGAVVTSGTSHSTFIGRNAGLNTTGSFNTAVGSSALETNTGTELNVAVGFNALRLISGTNNVAVGSDAGSSNTSGTNNTLLGHNAGRLGAAQSNVVAVGYFAANRNQANDTVAVGMQSLQNNTLGTANVAVGRSALGAATSSIATFTTTPVAAGSGYTANQTGVTVTLVKKSGADTFTGTVQAALTTNASGAVTAVAATPVSAGATFTGTNVIFEPSGFGAGSGCEISIATLATAANNTAVGHQAGLTLTTAVENSLVGSLAGDALTSGVRNSVLGYAALSAGTTANQSVAVGYAALLQDVTGSSNTAVGQTAAANIGASGAAQTLRMTAIGSLAGAYIGASPSTTALTQASDSVFIGDKSRANGNSQTNQVVIAGTDGLGDGSNTTVIGNTSTTSTRIPAGNLTLSNGNLILGTAGNGISFAATSDPSIPAVAATGAIRGTATNVANNDTVTIGTTVYTFKTTLTPANWEVLIGADASASLTNLRNAINNSGGTPGTDYVVPNAHPSVTAGAIAGRTLPLTAITAGTAGNSIALAETAAELSVSAATLQGGAAAAGMSGELLNDYETGTWSPRLESTGGTLVGVNIFSNAYYTKIGQLVTVQAYVYFNYADTSLASGQLQIAGLPYSVSGHAAAGIYSGQWTVSPVYVAASSGTTLGLYKRGSTSAQSGIASSVPADLDTSTTATRNQIMFTFTYRTA